MSRHNNNDRGRKAKDDVVMNENIRATELRVLIDGDEPLGVISRADALQKAEDLNLDLVLMSPNAKPPVAKIMDYGKHKYQLEKKKKEARKNQKTIDVKEVKFSCKIAQNDIDFKVKHAREFLEKGKYVKLRVFLRGREMSSPELGIDVLRNKVWPELKDIANLEQDASREGRYVNMLVTPIKK